MAPPRRPAGPCPWSTASWTRSLERLRAISTRAGVATQLRVSALETMVLWSCHDVVDALRLLTRLSPPYPAAVAAFEAELWSHRGEGEF